MKDTTKANAQATALSTEDKSKPTKLSKSEDKRLKIEQEAAKSEDKPTKQFYSPETGLIIK